MFMLVDLLNYFHSTYHHFLFMFHYLLEMLLGLLHCLGFFNLCLSLVWILCVYGCSSLFCVSRFFGLFVFGVIGLYFHLIAPSRYSPQQSAQLVTLPSPHSPPSSDYYQTDPQSNPHHPQY